jgi:hypothetical protein
MFFVPLFRIRFLSDWRAYLPRVSKFFYSILTQITVNAIPRVGSAKRNPILRRRSIRRMPFYLRWEEKISFHFRNLIPCWLIGIWSVCSIMLSFLEWGWKPSNWKRTGIRRMLSQHDITFPLCWVNTKEHSPYPESTQKNIPLMLSLHRITSPLCWANAE